MEGKKPEILTIPRFEDPRGNLSFIQNGSGSCPFDIGRVYWIYDVPGGREREGHAFREAREVIVALSGAFDAEITAADGTTRSYHLDRCDRGLYVPAGTWRALKHFTTNAVAMVLSSETYNPDDYIRDFNEYVRLLTPDIEH